MLWIPICVKYRLGKQRSIYFVLYAMLAAIAWTYRHVYILNYQPDFEAASLEHLGNLMLTYFFMGFGLVLFAIKFPERVFPKRFDFFGASHQIFHVFVVLGATTALFTMINMHKKGTFPYDE
jgi:adiponectin receptor